MEYQRSLSRNRIFGFVECFPPAVVIVIADAGLGIAQLLRLTVPIDIGVIFSWIRRA